MAKKLGKTEKTLLIAGGVAIGAYLLYKGMSGSNGGGSNYGGGNYVINPNQNAGGNSGGASVVDTVNTGLNIVKDVLDKNDWGGDSDPDVYNAKSLEDAVLHGWKTSYVDPYNYMVTHGTTTYTYPKTGNVVTLEEAKKFKDLYDRYAHDPAGLKQYLLSLKKK